MLYLASSSPRRKKLLLNGGIRFRVLKPVYREEGHDRRSPGEQVKRHALGKALSVLNKIEKGSILGADTLVYFRGQVIGKPKDRREAENILLKLQGRCHTVFTGVALLSALRGRLLRRKVFVEKTKVCLKKMTRKDIGRYFGRINPMDKAGAYAIQSKRADIVARIEGSFSNAVGLPMERLFEREGR